MTKLKEKFQQKLQTGSFGCRVKDTSVVCRLLATEDRGRAEHLQYSNRPGPSNFTRPCLYNEGPTSPTLVVGTFVHGICTSPSPSSDSDDAVVDTVVPSATRTNRCDGRREHKQPCCIHTRNSTSRIIIVDGDIGNRSVGAAAVSRSGTVPELLLVR